MINTIYAEIPESMIRLAVQEALTRSVYHPLSVSNFIIENMNNISIQTLKLIAEDIIIAIAEGKTSPIDEIIWDKLYDSIQKKLEEL